MFSKYPPQISRGFCGFFRGIPAIPIPMHISSYILECLCFIHQVQVATRSCLNAYTKLSRIAL